MGEIEEMQMVFSENQTNFQNTFSSNQMDNYFKDSPFGQYWEKILPPWALPYFGDSRCVRKGDVKFIDKTKSITNKKVEEYEKVIKMSDYGYHIYCDEKGSNLLEKYNDPNIQPNPNQIIVFMELDDGKFNFGKIVRVKLGVNVINDLKYHFGENIFTDKDSDDFAEEFLRRLVDIKDLKYSSVKKEVNINDNFEDLLSEAIETEFSDKQYDDLSYFLIMTQGISFLELKLEEKMFDLSNKLRESKFNEPKYWNGALENDEYFPLFIPKGILAFEKLEGEKIKLLSLSKIIEEKTETLFSYSNPLFPYIKIQTKQLTQNIDGYIKSVENQINEILKYADDFTIILKHLNAFYVGILNGILELVASVIDLLVIIIIDAQSNLEFKVLDIIYEKFEEFLNLAIYDTELFLSQCWEKLLGYIRDFNKWYDEYNGKSYQICKEIGEFLPDVLTIFLAWSKGKKVASIGSEKITEKIVSKEAAKESVEKLKKVDFDKLKKEALQVNKKKLDELVNPKVNELQEVVVKKKPKQKTAKERVESKKLKKITDKTVSNYLKKRAKYLKLNEKELLKLWKEKIIPKQLQRAELKRFYNAFIQEYPKLDGNNFAVFKTKIFKEGKLIEEVIEKAHSGPKKLYDDFLPTVKEEKFLSDLLDNKFRPRKNDSEVKYIYNFLENHIQKGDYFVIETTNIFIACYSCKREFLVLKELLGDKGKIVVKSIDEIKGTEELKDYFKIKK